MLEAYKCFYITNPGGTGSVACFMGADPEAYAMELYWAERLFKKSRKKPAVTISGVPHPGRRGGRIPGSDVSIVSWQVR